jgi:DNA-binding LacI/PurR family transcriptional regulator
MMYDREDSDYDIVSRYLTQIQTHLENAGHAFSFSNKTLQQLDMNVGRVARHVEQADADAWIVSSGSREILEWFAGQAKPAFALFGRRRGLAIAGIGPDKESAMRETTRHLIHLGHRRIVLLNRPSRRLPSPGLPERAFLETLNQAGIMTGDYNLPNWDGSVDGVQKILDEVFRLTPPTAVIVDEAQIFISVQNALARRGILAPEHVSLVSADQDPYFDYLRPSVAHVRYETEPWAKRITKWANNVAIGKDDFRQSLTKTELVKGGTMGPLAS